MFVKLDELAFAARTRQSIVDLITGVEDASGLAWNDRSPNWLTKGRIEKFSAELKAGIVRLGAVPIEMHGDCGGPDHAARASSIEQSTGYWCIAVHGQPAELVESVRDGSGAFRLDGQLYTSDLNACGFAETARSGCPCRPGVRQSEHTRVRHLAWPVDLASRLGELAAVHLDIRQAAATATERRRRSSIREQLLIALVELERLMVPENAEEHAARRLAEIEN